MNSTERPSGFLRLCCRCNTVASPTGCLLFHSTNICSFCMVLFFSTLWIVFRQKCVWQEMRESPPVVWFYGIKSEESHLRLDGCLWLAGESVLRLLPWSQRYLDVRRALGGQVQVKGWRGHRGAATCRPEPAPDVPQQRWSERWGPRATGRSRST